MALNKDANCLFEKSFENKICRHLLILVLVGTIVSFVYKAHYTGTSYDESMTFRDYCSSVHEARHNFKSTNNHVLNSILIRFAYHLSPQYEQFIRIFPMLSGVLFFLSMTFVITRMMHCRWLWVFGLIMVFCVRSVFNYLVMARGYTYGLSAMAMYLAVVFYFMQRPLSFKHGWVPVVLLSLLNFIALGAMISTVFLMIATNTVFVLFFCPMLYKETVVKIKVIVIHAVSIASLSGILLFLFYRPILGDILHADQNSYVVRITNSWKGWASYTKFINDLLNHQIFNASGLGGWLGGIFFILLAGLMILNIARIIRLFRYKQWGAYFKEHKYGFFVCIVFCVYFLVIFIYSVALKRSPGLLRNQYFMIPLFLLSFLWLIDKALLQIQNKTIYRLLLVSLCVYLAMTGYHNTPRLRSIGKGGMGMSRPTLKRLQSLDPEKEWNIAFSKEMQYHYMGFLYYKQFGYKFNVNTGPNSNVYICRPKERIQGGVLLDYEYFLKSNNCFVTLLDKQNPGKVIFEAKPKIVK